MKRNLTLNELTKKFLVHNINFLLIGFLLVSNCYLSQSGIIKGTVVDEISNETIPFANIFIENTKSGVTSDLDGNYKIENLKPGLYNITCSYIGYKPKSFSEVIVSSNKPTNLTIKLIESSTNLEEVEKIGRASCRERV